MAIEVYLSRQSAGRNPARESVLERIVQAYNNTPFRDRAKIFVLTPRQDTYQVERELIERIGQGGLFGLQVTDVERLQERIVAEEGPGLEIVDSHGRLMLMQKSLRDVKDDLTVYNASADKQGFAEQVIDEISVFKKASITPEILKEKSERFSGTLLADKMEDLGKIFGVFSENLGKDRIDEDDLQLEALHLAGESDYLDNAQIFVLDETSLDYSTAVFLARAHGKAKSVTVALAGDEDRTAPDMSAFLVVNDSLSLLRRVAGDYGVGVDIKREFFTPPAGPLGHLSHEFFSYAPKPYGEKVEGGVKVHALNEPWEEVSRAAQLILGEVKAGRSFSEISVAMTDPETYDDLVRRVFSQYQIPIFVDENHKVTDNHFIQSILFALDAVASGFNRADVVGYIKSDFSGFNSNEADLLENYLIEAGIKPNEWRKEFKRLPAAWKWDEESTPDNYGLNRMREHVLKRLGYLAKGPNEKATYSEFSRRLINYLVRTKSQEKLDELSESIAQAGAQELSSRYRQIWNILLEVLEQVENALGPTETDFTEFVSVLKAGLASYEIGVIPEDQDAVIIASLARTRLPAIKSLYILGMNEGLLPKSTPETGLLSEHDKDRLGDLFNLEMCQTGGKRYQHELEEANLYMMATKPSHRLTALYSRFDKDGGKLEPSRYINVLNEIYGESVEGKAPKVFPLLSSSNAEALLESMDAGGDEYANARRIINEWLNQKRFKREVQILIPPIDGYRLQSDDVLYEHNAAELYYGNDRPKKVSVSRLEQFADCPFKHFLRYGLRPREREEYEVRAFDTGIIIHEVFDKFIKDISQRANGDPKEYERIIKEYLDDGERLKSDSGEVFSAVFDELEDTSRYNHYAASRYLVVKIKRIIDTALRMMLLQLLNSGFAPEMTEQTFSEEMDSGLIVEGRIDRIDLLKEGAEGNELPVRVIDYKTGNKKIDYTDLFYGRALQLAVYLSEALKLFEDRSPLEPVPGGAFYFLADNAMVDNPKTADLLNEVANKFHLVGLYDEKESMNLQGEVGGSNGRGAKYVPGKLSRDQVEMVLRHSRRKVEELSDRLISGEMRVRPVRLRGVDEGCRFCNYDDICRFNGSDKENTAIGLPRLDEERFFELVEREESNE